ncbi:SDR family oxidoreductase [Conexibacter sp. JD483]|uniref:SDR family oxidoreductase n=1 Tax=unclassified Conexibacter TaxID=2627773 RepID=UPI002726A72D|nr:MULTISPECIES: SDR family oxidoreductase [unclassified Conexibacter]MDO8186829.1 SDR family oxidoreductase [Conexibacter sp. CPCC 205706]MDO8197417.1 SDR family oxidoreductase [Conexibacter sp. CPCC 205762]MDR9371233.1 SDR family oxidoreductase [Conexibacter sp. JD483]
MSGIVEGRVAIVTGAGQGLGRAHAHAYAQEGARVVVNDVGTAAEQVAQEIRAAGGDAVAHAADVADWEQAAGLVAAAVERYGRLDVLVNNAGIVRDRMLVSMSEQEWDAVLRVNLKGHFVPLRHAAEHWRGIAKAGGDPQARIVNTSSGAGLLGSVGQGNYAAAKAGVAALTQVAAAELGRYGIAVNAIAPSARTPMTEAVFAEAMARPQQGFDAMDPANVSPLVVWLGSVEAGGVSGRVFEVEGGKLSVADGWRYSEPADNGERWQPARLGPVIAELIERAPVPPPVYGAA